MLEAVIGTNVTKNQTVFKITGKPLTEVVTGGFHVRAGGATVKAGGLVVSAGGEKRGATIKSDKSDKTKTTKATKTKARARKERS